MSDGVDAASEAADNNDIERSEAFYDGLGDILAVVGVLACANDADSGQIKQFKIALIVEFTWAIGNVDEGFLADFEKLFLVHVYFVPRCS